MLVQSPKIVTSIVLVVISDCDRIFSYCYPDTDEGNARARSKFNYILEEFSGVSVDTLVSKLSREDKDRYIKFDTFYDSDYNFSVAILKPETGD